MTMDLTEQEMNYLLQVVVQRPLVEALPIYLKLTKQVIVAEPPAVPATSPHLTAVQP
jgi:hypothetical protein